MFITELTLFFNYLANILILWNQISLAALQNPKQNLINGYILTPFC